jgi:hypothetical protein
MSEESEITVQESKSNFLKLKKLLKSSIFKKIIISLFIILFIAMGISIYFLNKKIVEANGSLSIHELIYHSVGDVDLSTQSLQKITDELKAGRFIVTQNLDGIKVNGVILNMTAINYKNLELEITVNNESKTINIMSIPAGSGSYFNVYIPNVPINKSRWANIKFKNGLINYKINPF